MSSHWDTIQTFDYAFVADVDMVFVRHVGIEVCSRKRALHAGLWLCVDAR